MANSKISALASATTPLAGTEVLPVVQSSATTQVTVANLTAGRAVNTALLSVVATQSTDAQIRIRNSTARALGNKYGIRFADSANETNGSIYCEQKSAGNDSSEMAFLVNSGTGGATLISGVEFMRASTTGNVQITTGNVVQGTAAKGFDFSANTPLAGKTSTLLNWYEEGTWTPNQGAGLTLVGAFSSTGTYTRIGRQVSVSGTVTGATSVAVTAAGVITSNLPFTVGTAGHGDATNAAITASASVVCTGTSVTSAAAIAATVTITFSATYFA